MSLSSVTRSASNERESVADLEPPRRLLQDLLSVVRAHLRMDVAFVSRVAGGSYTLEHLDADPGFPLQEGASGPVEETYCARVLDGRIPGLIIDAAQEPGVADLAATRQLPIRSHLSVPVSMADGSVYGTLCCFSRAVEPSLNERDLNALRMFADIVSKHLEPLVVRERTIADARERIEAVLDEGGPAIALQPIFDLATDQVSGYEALARFPAGAWNTEQWFVAAHGAGMGTALESAAVHAAVSILPKLPQHLSLAINVSAPALLTSASIATLFARPDGARLVLEVTEHQQIADPHRLGEILARVRAAGVRVAVDDAGSGYSGLQRILTLNPEVIKLDRLLVDGVAHHQGRQAMCEAMANFARRSGATIVAEGIETEADLTALRDLGVTHAQGYLLGRPRLWSAMTQDRLANP